MQEENCYMPTLEERRAETKKNLKIRLQERSEELGVSIEFSEYIEMMETYLLTLERRVLRLEKEHGFEGKDVLLMEL